MATITIMKELSIEGKATRYDQAIKVAKSKIKNDKDHVLYEDDVIEIFPELKESEDERIRKEIIEHIKWSYDEQECADEEMHRWISWLEKQGEHANFRNKIQIGDKVTRNRDGVLVNLSQLNRVAKKDEKQGEKKPADKVEPKFEIGDWVVYDHRAYQVVELPKKGYINLGLKRNGKIEFAPSTYCRLWTIQDAKDGDVLACPNDAGDRDVVFIFKNINSDEGWVFCFCASDANGCFCTNNDYVGNSNSTNISPATKEQRDALMKKMADAGLEFDFDKKELKKIEQKSAEWHREDEQNLNACLGFIPDAYLCMWLKDVIHVKYDKPVWSEEDEKILKAIHNSVDVECLSKNGLDYVVMVDWFNSLKDRVQPKQNWSEEDENRFNNLIFLVECSNENEPTKKGFIDFINRLKSLRPQNRWKPSDEQMNVLLTEVTAWTKGCPKQIVLESLYNDLKKLKE